jgi:hypothetical protein
MGATKSYAERLFDFAAIGPLPDREAKVAIAKPTRAQGVDIEEAALDLIVEQTHGYP